LSHLGFTEHPMDFLVSAISVGIVDGEVVLDLDYDEDSTAQVDLNLVMAESGTYIEVQGTAEGFPFSHDQLLEMLDIGRRGCAQLVEAQRVALAKG